MRRRALAAGALGLLAAGVAVVALARDGSGGDEASAGGSTPTTTITRRDLVEVDTTDGTLGYSDSRTVVNRLSGTVTWLPRAGSVVRTNRRLFAVDGEAVYLLDGSFPAYRDLAPGTKGQDVRELERNMRALGYDSARAMTVDGTWDAGTTAAVRRWQAARDLSQTGTIELGRVVFAPGDRRVSKLALQVGSSAGGSGGGGGAATPSAYRGEATMTLAFYRAGDGDGPRAVAAQDDPTASEPPAITTPQATTTTPQTSTTPQTTTTTPQTSTPQTTTTPHTATTPAANAPSRPKPEATAKSKPKPTSARSTATPAAASRGAAGSGSSGAGGDASRGDSGGDSSVATDVMTTTSTRRIVTVKLDTTKGSLAKQDARVSVELPSGDIAHGAIAQVSRTAQTESSADGQTGSPTIKLTIKLTGRIDAIDQAPVTVRLEQSRARNVLAIPVTALLARSGGRFAVEVVERSGARRTVPVTTGLFTSGYVEIEGAGLRPGMRVADARV